MFLPFRASWQKVIRPCATPTPPTVRFRLMVHPPAMRAFVYSVETRLFRTCLSLVSERGHFRGGSFLVMLRPARWLGRLTSPRRPLLQSPTGPPVYGRACPSRGLPQPESAITTRLNHLLPRRDSHPLACQGSKAAHRIMAGQPHLAHSARAVFHFPTESCPAYSSASTGGRNASTWCLHHRAALE